MAWSDRGGHPSDPQAVRCKMVDRSEKNRHHVVSAVVLAFGLLSTLAARLLRDFLPEPFGVPVWAQLLVVTLIIVPLRALFTELGIRRSRTPRRD
jgi:hypothetical protein